MGSGKGRHRPPPQERGILLRSERLCSLRLKITDVCCILITDEEIMEDTATLEHMIESNPLVMMGKPVVAGTRVTVELILEKLGAGETVEQILKEHPRLTREGILAAVRFGGEALRADVAYPVVEGN